MSFWVDKVAVVTDSESGLGMCIIKALAQSGMIVIGFCKTLVSLNNVKAKLNLMHVNDQVILCKCDITDVNQLKGIFAETIEKYHGASVLINNAFCNISCCLSDGTLKDIKRIIDVNINAVVTCNRLTAGHIIEKNHRGHIIFITDIAQMTSIHSNMFKASRAAVNSINDILREEFRYMNANIKVTNIVCGNYEEIEEIASKNSGKEVAEIVKFVLNTPEHLQIHEVRLDLD